MARRKRNHVQVSMFPFLSVLCTVIGVLVLFIVLILSTRVVVEDEKFRATQEHQRKPRPGRENVIEEGIDPQTRALLEAELARIERMLDDRERERYRLQRKLANLESALEFKRTELLIPLTKKPRPKPLTRPEPVHMVPDDGRRIDLAHVLVEVSSRGYTIHPSRQSFPAIQTQVTDDGGFEYTIDPDLNRFLRGVDQRRKREYLLFLIHPNGVSSFDALRYYLDDHHARIRRGWEPFSRNWIVTQDQD